MSDRIKSGNPLYNELLLAQEELEEIRGMPIINVGEVAWRQKCKKWDGAWVLILSKENMWYIDKDVDGNYREKPGQPASEQFYCYEVLCPDGQIMRYTDAVLRKEKE
tara:strand:+ start:137 stop:457 length:321 start_codon:yes stop_codon:yes gene_type:complete